MARQPEVITGYRGPRDETREAAPASPAKAIPEGKTVFQFIASRYRLQLTAPRSIVLPDGRIEPGARPLVVVADEGFKTLDNKKDAKTIELVRQHNYYGTDFWDYSETLKGIQEARTKSAISVLDDPESRAKIIEALKQMGEDVFKLPAPQTQAQAKGKTKKQEDTAPEAGE